MAKAAFYDYEFEEAADLLEEYQSMQAKAKKPLDENFDKLVEAVNIATNAFDRVQKIVVVDSIDMPRAAFFKAFRLADSAGRVNRVKDFSLPFGTDNEEVGFISEGKDFILTSETGQDGSLKLVEYQALLDGTWEKQDALRGDIEFDGDYAFPFLNGDGQTIYFANNGNQSIGGYDIFVAQKDPLTGEILQPLNVGMPFNSPYDDLMMVIDEETGVGWWATDRNDPGNHVTIYVYILDETRKNYPADTENLVELAKLKDYKATWEVGREDNYKKLLDTLPK